MAIGEKPQRSWNIDMLFVLGKREGIKAKHLRAIPVLILERWIQGGREEGTANYVWTNDLARRLVDSGLVPPFKPKGTSVILASMTTIQASRNLTRPPFIEYRGDGMFWVNLPHYEPLLQEYRPKYRELYPEDYEKLFPDGEPVWEPSGKAPSERRETKPRLTVSEVNNDIHSLLAPVEQVLRDQQQAIERLRGENKKLQAELQTALNNVKEVEVRAEEAETKVIQLENQFAKINDKSEYIHSSRVVELRAISSQQFDLTRLIELCDELNDSYVNGRVLAVPMLVRAIIDHVPPILGYNTFAEIVNNYGGPHTSKSFRKSMQNLQNSLRNIADASIHTTIRSKEILPNSTQIDFSPDLDVLLAEIVRILK